MAKVVKMRRNEGNKEVAKTVNKKVINKSSKEANGAAKASAKMKLPNKVNNGNELNSNIAKAHEAIAIRAKLTMKKKDRLELMKNVMTKLIAEKKYSKKLGWTANDVQSFNEIFFDLIETTVSLTNREMFITNHKRYYKNNVTGESIEITKLPTSGRVQVSPLTDADGEHKKYLLIPRNTINIKSNLETHSSIVGHIDEDNENIFIADDGSGRVFDISKLSGYSNANTEPTKVEDYLVDSNELVDSDEEEEIEDVSNDDYFEEESDSVEDYDEEETEEITEDVDIEEDDELIDDDDESEDEDDDEFDFDFDDED
jgi:hypothetical protein